MNKTSFIFQLRMDRAKEGGLCPIYLNATVNGSRKYFTIKRSVPAEAWDDRRQEVNSSFPDYQVINNDIALYRAKAEKMRMVADMEDEIMSLFQFEKMFRSGIKDLKDIFTFIEDDIKEFGNTYARDTIKSKEAGRKQNVPKPGRSKKAGKNLFRIPDQRPETRITLFSFFLLHRITFFGCEKP